MADSDIVRKTLVSFVIEKTLFDFGGPVYEKIVDMLYNKYRCNLDDCYENPEYLKEVLKDLFGRSYDVIIKSIENELSSFTDHERVRNFVQVLVSKT